MGFKKRLVLTLAAAMAAAPLFAQSPAPVRKAAPSLGPIDRKVNSLLSKMTLEEKIGQLVQWAPWKSTEDKIKKDTGEGKVGSLLNVWGAKNTNAYQKIAVEQSRLHIPLLFGLDVIHGYKTIFPIPLAEDCAWNPELLEKCA